MGNDLKYGLVLGAVVLLIFLGYYAIHTRTPQEPLPASEVVNLTETPPEVNIFDTTPVPTPQETVVYDFGTVADTPAAGAPGTTQAQGGASEPGVVSEVEQVLPPTQEPPGLPSLVPPESSVTPATTYKIASGDTLGAISKKFYGTTTKWREIMAANSDIITDEAALVVGTEIVIPQIERSSPVLEAATERSTPAASGRTHTVAKGDTLYSIAVKYYGDGNEYKKIYEANRDKMRNPDALKIGMVLAIP